MFSFATQILPDFSLILRIALAVLMSLYEEMEGNISMLIIMDEFLEKL